MPDQVIPTARQQQSNGRMDGPLTTSYEQHIDSDDAVDSRNPVAQHTGSTFGHDAPFLNTAEEMHLTPAVDPDYKGELADANVADSRLADEDANTVHTAFSEYVCCLVVVVVVVVVYTSSLGTCNVHLFMHNCAAPLHAL